MELKPNPQRSCVCVVCRTHTRPCDVPWPQHAMGCAVRAAQLHHEVDLRRVAALAGRAAAA